MDLRILVAANSETMRRTLVDSLRVAGVAEVVEAEDGDDALWFFQQRDFDLVLTGFTLSGRSGLELIRAIRAEEAHVPVVLVLAGRKQRKMGEAVCAGASDCLTAPFHAAKLKRMLTDLLL